MEIAGIHIEQLTRKQSIVRALGDQAMRVYFVNAHCVNVAQRDSAYRQALSQAELVLNDGAGLELAGRWLGQPFPENLNGTDWIPALLDRLPPGSSLYLLGAKPRVVVKAQEAAKARWPALSWVGARDGYGENEEVVLAEIEQLRPELLIVGMGVPKQELFIFRHWTRLQAAGVKRAIAGGAILDFLSGEVARAPLWMRCCRIEWLFRLLQEPERLWRRYLIGNGSFLVLLLKEWWRVKWARHG